MHRRLVTVFLKNIPGAEDQIIKLGQWDKIFDQWGPAFRALAQADRSHLCQAADWPGNSFANRFDAGDKRRRHRAHSNEQNSELAIWLGDWRPFLQHTLFSFILSGIRCAPALDRKAYSSESVNSCWILLNVVAGLLFR